MTDHSYDDIEDLGDVVAGPVDQVVRVDVAEFLFTPRDPQTDPIPVGDDLLAPGAGGASPEPPPAFAAAASPVEVDDPLDLGFTDDVDQADEHSKWLRENVFDDHPRTERPGPKAGGLLRGLGAAVLICLVVAGLVFGTWYGLGFAPTPDPDPDPTPSETLPLFDVKEATPGQLPGYTAEPAWSMRPPAGAAKGATSLGLVLVTPGELSLASISTGETVFSAPAADAVTSTLGVRFGDQGPPDTLMWTSGSRISFGDEGLTSLGVDAGCVASAAAGSPLISCPELDYWINRANQLVQIPQVEGRATLGVSGTTAIAVQDRDFVLTDLVTGGATNVELEPVVADAALHRLVGVGASLLVSVWQQPGGGFLLALHDLSGQLLDSAPVSAEVAAAKLVRGAGSQVIVLGDAIIDASARKISLPRTGCVLQEAVGLFVAGTCPDLGAGVFRLGVFWQGAQLPLATSPDGAWAMVEGGGGAVVGLSREP